MHAIQFLISDTKEELQAEAEALKKYEKEEEKLISKAPIKWLGKIEIHC